MNATELERRIEELWERREGLSPNTSGDERRVVDAALEALDSGAARVAEPGPGGWRVNQWLKKAVLLSFRLTDSAPMQGPGGAPVWDKVPMKFAGWGENRFREAGFRAVPGAVVRRSAYIAPGVGADAELRQCRVPMSDRNTMVDTWATVGSCAQIGKNCHLSGGVGIGGVLEPLQANPVIIEDDCFIGARSEVAEGVIVERGAVLSMGVFIGASTKVVDRATGEIHVGRVPAYSVVVPGSLPGRTLPDGSPGPSLYCAVIVKRWTRRRGPRPRSTSCCAIERIDPLDPVAARPGADPLRLGHPGRCRGAGRAGASAGAPGFHGAPRLRFGEIENLFARRGDGAPHLCFAGHTDVVPVGAAHWRHDPFGGEVRDGVLYGRGACDMKGGDRRLRRRGGAVLAAGAADAARSAC